MDNLTKERIYRSVPLSKEEIADLKKWIKDSNNSLQIDAAKALDISRTTLRNILRMKTCAHKTYQKIKAVIAPATAA